MSRVPISFLSALVFISAILHLRAEYMGPRRHVYFFKPLTMFFIILIAWQTKNSVSSFYKYAIICGLAFSLAGDIFLMLPSDRFISGLVSFLLAHLFYIAAFTFEGARSPGVLVAVPLLIYGALMLRILLPHLGSMKAPVVIYMLVILLMAWQALNRWMATAEEQGSALALVGALLFVVSDSLLALNRFKSRFRGAQAYIMSTYFMAQWLIALST
ncbi:MAG: lysoplasmalogenase [Acidobacteria bacterium]|nr:lysoplasmalogenase [Acidobacteriota bacterium]